MLFRFRGRFLNGKPGYELGVGMFLFWRESTAVAGTYRWYISFEWDSTSNIIAYADSLLDAPPVSGYKEWCDSAWADSPLSVVDTAQRQVRGVTCQTSLESSAFTFKETLNGKPGYENGGGYFLFWRASSAGVYRWYMSSNWDSTTAFAYITSSDDVPPSSGWREWCSSAWGDSSLNVVGSAASQVTEELQQRPNDWPTEANYAACVGDSGGSRRSFASKHEKALNKSSVISTRDNSCTYPDRIVSGTTCRVSHEGPFTFRGFHNDRPAYENEGGTYLYWRTNSGAPRWMLVRVCVFVCVRECGGAN